MEQVRTIVAYHVSKPDGGWCYVWRNAPFLSKKKRNGQSKWLTDGYYFWTDSDKFAHQWGRVAYAGQFAISRCKVAIPEPELLDLVGNVEDQQFFRTLLEKVKLKYEREQRSTNLVTVPGVIDWARDKKFLPHAAIKASDCPKEAIEVPYKNQGKSAFLQLPTRQQICVFEGFEGYFQTETVVYPEDFKLAIENVYEQKGRCSDERSEKCRTTQPAGCISR